MKPCEISNLCKNESVCYYEKYLSIPTVNPKLKCECAKGFTRAIMETINCIYF